MGTRAVESAVSFAASMVRKGEYVGKAINVAARYYGVDRSEVQRGMAARAGRSQKGKARAPRPVRQCQNCGEQEACWHGTVQYGFNAVHVYTCAQCGQDLPCWWECGGDERYDSLKWTAYRPSRQ